MQNIFDEIIVVKRSGQRVHFDGTKIAVAIKKAFDQVYDVYEQKKVNKVYLAVLNKINKEFKNRKTIQVETIQDTIEEVLKEQKLKEVYSAFNEYRLKRSASRDAFLLKQHHKLGKMVGKVNLAIDGSQSILISDLTSRLSGIVSQEFAKAYLIDSKYIRAHEEGKIYIPNLEVYSLGMTDSANLNFIENQFCSLYDFTNYILETIYEVKQEQFGEHIINNLDSLYKPIMLREFKRIYKDNISIALNASGIYEYINFDLMNEKLEAIESIYFDFAIFGNYIKNDKISSIFKEVYHVTLKQLEGSLKKQLNRLLEKLSKLSFLVNNNLISITLGLNNGREEKLFLTYFMDVLQKLDRVNNITIIYHLQGNNDTTILQKVEKLISSKKNIVFANNDYDYLNSGVPLISGQVFLSSITINLPRLGIMNAGKKLETFFNDLEEIMELSKNQLMQRFEFQANKYKENYNYLFQNNILLDSKKLENNQKVRKVIKNGALSINYVGLIDCVCILKNKDKFSIDDIDVAFQIIKFMNQKIEQYRNESKIKFVLCENNVRDISKNLLAIDKAIYGLNYLANKKDYMTFSQFIHNLKLDLKKQIEIYENVQSLTCFKAIIEKSKDIKNLNGFIQNMAQAKLNYYQIEVTSDEY